MTTTSPLRLNRRLFIAYCIKHGFFSRRSPSQIAPSSTPSLFSPSSGLLPEPPFDSIRDNLIDQCLGVEIFDSIPVDRRFPPESIGGEASVSAATAGVRNEIDDSDGALDRLTAELSSSRASSSQLRSVVEKGRSFALVRRLPRSSNDVFSSNPILSILAFLPSSKSLSTRLRNRERFYRYFAEKPNHVAIDDDAIRYKFPSLTDGDGDADAIATRCKFPYLADDDAAAIDALSDPKGILLERVVRRPSIKDAAQKLITDSCGGGALRVGDVMELRVDVELAVLAYLVDAYLLWPDYENFTLNFLLAPTKVVVLIDESVRTNEKVLTAVEWIVTKMRERGLTCVTVKWEKSREKYDIVANYIGRGTPFYIYVDKSAFPLNWVLRVHQRDTMAENWVKKPYARPYEEIHLSDLPKKLEDYVKAAGAVGRKL